MKSLRFVFLFAALTTAMVLPKSIQAGPLSFAKAVPYNSGGLAADSVAVADLNGDGHPDLVVANCQTLFNQSICDDSFTSGSVSVLLGNGDGTFQAAVSYSLGGNGATSVAVADLNGDGHPDLVVATWCQNSPPNCGNGGVSVLLGNGDGTFQAPVSYSSGALYATSVAIADVNGDGHPDVVVGNFCQDSQCHGSVSVLLGNGDGTFQAAVSYGSGGYEVTSVAVVDVNGDGHPDLIVANGCLTGGGCGSTVGVLIGNGDGTFQGAITYDVGGFVFSVSVADVNGDGKPDIVAAGGLLVAVLLGNGDGTFKAGFSYSSTTILGPVAVADLNGDGKPDIVVVVLLNPGTQNGGVRVLLGNGDGTFKPPVQLPAGGYMASFVAIADVNGDRRPDTKAVRRP
jgi:hypothetical protein